MNLKPEARSGWRKFQESCWHIRTLKLQIEGYTDSIGSDEYNQTLSDKKGRSGA